VTRNILKMIIKRELEKRGIKDEALADGVIDAIELAFKIEAEIGQSAHHKVRSQDAPGISAVKAPVPTEAIVSQGASSGQKKVVVMPDESAPKIVETRQEEEWERGLTPQDRARKVAEWMERLAAELTAKLPPRFEVQSSEGLTVEFLMDPVRKIPQTECVQVSYRPAGASREITVSSGPIERPQPGSFHGKITDGVARNEMVMQLEVRRNFFPMDEVDAQALVESIKRDAAGIISKRTPSAAPNSSLREKPIRMDPVRDFADGVADEA